MLLAFTAEISAALHIERHTALYTLRFVLGQCEASFFPGMVLYFNYCLPSHKQSSMLTRS
jgi:hypothetical protein